MRYSQSALVDDFIAAQNFPHIYIFRKENLLS